MLKSKPFTLHDKPVKISQASWDMVMIRTELEEEAKPKEGESLLHTPLAFFAKTFYPSFAACTDPMPSLQEAYEAANDWDAWYLVVRDLNPSWFGNATLTEESITFSDGKTITVQSPRPSTIMKMEQLDYEASQQPTLENPRREIFRVIYYPHLAGCSIGDVPDPEYARAEMSADDLQLWYDAAARLNPDWFMPFEQIAKQNQEEAKKNSVTPA